MATDTILLDVHYSAGILRGTAVSVAVVGLGCDVNFLYCRMVVNIAR